MGSGRTAENVVLMIMDTVRAESAYPERSDLTPNLARLAEQGCTFEHAIAASPWSLPSHATLFTGLYPSEHGVSNHNRYLRDEIPTLAERLSEAGFTTGVFTPNVFLSGSFNMDRGFDERSFMMEDKYFEEGFSRQTFMMHAEWETRLEWYRLLADRIREGPVLKNLFNLLYSRIPNQILYGRTITERKDWDNRAVAKAEEFIRSATRRDERFFCTVNVLAAHGPWAFDRDQLAAIGTDPDEIAPPETWEAVADVSEEQWPYAAGELEFSDTEREILQHLYESWVHRADALIHRVVETLEETGAADDTLVIVTSDHGEMLAEDGVLGHSVSVDKRCVGVPLVMTGPGIGTDSVGVPVSLKNVFGTVLSRTGVDPDAADLMGSARGVALSETEGLPIDRVTDHVEEVNDAVRRATQPRRALFTEDGWAERRYDSGETFGDEATLEELDELVAELEPVVSTDAREVGLDQQAEDRLEQLGYI